MVAVNWVLIEKRASGVQPAFADPVMCQEGCRETKKIMYPDGVSKNE